MKYAFLVAWREYAENAKTKGFWISLFLMPTILFLSAQVPIWLEQKATPTRHFVLVDQSGTLAPVIEASIDRGYQQKVLSALREYAHKNTNPVEAWRAGIRSPTPAVCTSGVADHTEQRNEPGGTRRKPAPLLARRNPASNRERSSRPRGSDTDSR